MPPKHIRNNPNRGAANVNQRQPQTSRQQPPRTNTYVNNNGKPPANLDGGTKAGGSMHDQTSPNINQQLDLLLKKMENMNENFMTLSQNVKGRVFLLIFS